MCNQEKADNFKFYPDILGPMSMNSDFMILTHRIQVLNDLGAVVLKYLVFYNNISLLNTLCQVLL